MTLQLRKLVPDFLQGSTAAGMIERSAPPPSKPSVKGDIAEPARVPPGQQTEIVPEAPAGMWGY